MPGKNVERGADGTVYAALDLGSNNCRLTVAREGAKGPEVITTFSRIVRLAEGVAETGRLDQSAMARTVEALKICGSALRRHKVGRSRAVATAACRRAANVSEFVALVFENSGIRLEVISEAEEARLALLGAQPLLDSAFEYGLLCDIGGGSTELIWTRKGAAGGSQMLGWTSFALGVVTLAERHGSGPQGLVSPETFEAMIGEAEPFLRNFEEVHGIAATVPGGDAMWLGTSGTMTTLAGVHLELAKYDRAKVDGLWLGGDDIRSLGQRLAVMNTTERAEIPCIGQGRADLVVAGCAVVEAMLRVWPFARLRVADRGLREGVLEDLMKK